MIDPISFGFRVSSRRKALKMSQDELARLVGYKSKVSIFRIEHGKSYIPFDKIDAIASALSVDVAYLIGEVKHTDTSQHSKTVPVFDAVAAGLPITATENIVDYEQLDMRITEAGEYFGVRVKGHSMEPRIADGDVVIVRCQQCVQNGDIVIALIGDEATVKKLRREPDGGVWLIPINPAYDALHYTPEDAESIKILGKVVELRAKL